jgi:SAM-dependent methyltransferase
MTGHMDSERAWERHYTRDRSVLRYPDENLVRMLAPFLKERGARTLRALDLGCGTGRHVGLLLEMGLERPLGLDTSFNALSLCAGLYDAPFVQADARSLPVSSDSLDIVVAWGSLHYTVKGDLAPMLAGVLRVLGKGGRLFGTLRNTRDTFLKKGLHLGNDVWKTGLDDIESSTVAFYSEDELRAALSPFSSFQYGFMERSPLGKPDSVISHWYFWAEK